MPIQITNLWETNYATHKFVLESPEGIKMQMALYGQKVVCGCNVIRGHVGIGIKRAYFTFFLDESFR